MVKSEFPKSDKRHPGGAKSATSMAELLASTGYNIPTLKRGQEVSGKVIAISPQEILIDIGAKSEGIVTGRELAAVRDMIAKLSVGDTTEAMVLYPENDAGQVVLSLRKHSGEKRWMDLEDKRQSGEGVEVVALEVNRGGVICDFWGIRGFLPASQIALPVGRQAPSKLADLIGRTLACRVIEVDRTTNRLILSQKQPDRRDLKELLALLAKIKIGEKYPGVVTAALPFGVFVEIEAGKAGSAVSSPTAKSKRNHDKSLQLQALSGTPPTDVSREGKGSKGKLEGLVHISEISWEKIDDPTKLFKVGDKVEVMVIAKDETTGRLNLSIKQLAHDPFLEVSSKYSEDQTVSGTISKVTPHGVFVNLEEGIEGLIHIAKIPPNESWEVGNTVECIVDSIDTKARRILLVPVAREKPVLYR